MAGCGGCLICIHDWIWLDLQIHLAVPSFVAGGEFFVGVAAPAAFGLSRVRVGWRLWRFLGL